MKAYKVKEKQKRVERVYTTAARTLYQKGYDKTSIRDIARATDMTTAGLYYYFKNKEELLFQILSSHMDDMISGIEKIQIEKKTPLDLIKEYILYQINSYCSDKYRTKLMLTDDDCLTGDLYKEVKNKQRQYLGYWRKALNSYFIQEGITNKNIAIDAHCLLGMIVWIYRWYDPKGEINPETLALKIFETFVFGLSSKEKLSS